MSGFVKCGQRLPTTTSFVVAQKPYAESIVAVRRTEKSALAEAARWNKVIESDKPHRVYRIQMHIEKEPISNAETA